MFPLLLYVSEQTHKLPERFLGPLWATSDVCTLAGPFLVCSSDFLCVETLSAVRSLEETLLKGLSCKGSRWNIAQCALGPGFLMHLVFSSCGTNSFFTLNVEGYIGKMESCIWTRNHDYSMSVISQFLFDVFFRLHFSLTLYKYMQYSSEPLGKKKAKNARMKDATNEKPSYKGNLKYTETKMLWQSSWIRTSCHLYIHPNYKISLLKPKTGKLK